MRTTVEIDDRLMKEVMELTGLKTKRAVVIHALEELIRERGLGGQMDDGREELLGKRIGLGASNA